VPPGPNVEPPLPLSLFAPMFYPVMHFEWDSNSLLGDSTSLSGGVRFTKCSNYLINNYLNILSHFPTIYMANYRELLFLIAKCVVDAIGPSRVTWHTLNGTVH